ncbi:MAG: DUF2189 domain-containing protein [Candidatus Thiodiazotropha weberae]|uniref:DUF2189 domain-containing protein n=1 Tax=Candidatus Thiodiazotropha endoloripes TaxID=1818881 RepID=A0A1E2UVC7_9GAMM|nr:DUF2189 domain-containing protein [Candidatus Thiodiazotropha endoloripes]MCG7900566.1 DUF2189 domain-containing protein [Candidatus Thiodiazotropha weberae]ODB87343.1 hypothetical protein A3195_16475 [Candidatus Thiodiazotropha endoloripes]ODB89436.1 hypothetical protein A3193_10250 [Candidatus Thiodiazotropha endoloripes]ODB98708.1 hypothetical protein A3196_16970 [Candidatus Thiodiazotropha endoloripes]
MSHTVIHHYDARPVTIAQVRDIGTDHPWMWLSAGWQDIKAAPAQSLGYGLVLAIISYLITISVVSNGMFFLFPQLVAGFFLIAPLLAIGLYAISRQLEAGEEPSLRMAMKKVWKNSFHTFNMGLVLIVALIAWVTLAQLIVALTFTGITPATWQGFLTSLFGSWQGLQLLVVGVSCGAVIAFIIFSISVVSVPMMVDRDCNVFDAIQTSWNAVRYNFLAMFLWAAILVTIIIAGFVTLYAGLVFLFPLAAHATWHAYRDLVEQK